jgi:acyl carrier protein
VTESRRLTFEEFRGFLSETLGVAEAALTPDARFLGDLGIDSIKLVELMFQIELRLGVRVPSDAAWEIQTVGQAYEYYVQNT